MVRILVMSDTHLDQLTPGIPDIVLHEIKNCDLVIHAGDFTGEGCYRQLSSLADVTAVQGNMDSAILSGLLPVKLLTTVENVRIGVVHGTGSPQRALQYAHSAFMAADIIVFGHSHQPLNQHVNGVLMFNPGSPTDSRRADFPTYGIIEIENDKFQAKIVPVEDL